MKKNLLYFMAGLALCATAASCSSDDDAVSAPKTLSATATIDNSNTRTSYTEGTERGLKVDWKESETFKAYYEGGSAPLTFTKTAGSAFVATNVPAGVSAATPFTGVYGENVTYDAATGKYTVDYSGQDGTLENLAKYDAMVATSTTDAQGRLHFPFKHLSAFLRVTLKQDQSTEGSYPDGDSTEDGQKYVAITFGNAKINDENMNVEGWTTKKLAYTVKLTLGQKLTEGETRDVYIAVPPMTGVSGDATIPMFGEGYTKTVKMYGSSGLIGSSKADISLIEAGKVYETSITYFCGMSHNLPQW